MAKRLTISTRITIDSVGNTELSAFLRVNNVLIAEKNFKHTFTEKGLGYLDIVDRLDIDTMLQENESKIEEFGS